MSAATRSFFLQPMLLRRSISQRCCSSLPALSSTAVTAVVQPLLSAQTICNYSTSRGQQFSNQRGTNNNHRSSSSSSSRIRRRATSSNTKSCTNNNFLTPGFQPTAITGDNIGFYHGSTFYDGVPPNTLPKLDAACILSPGKYCKQSSWALSSSSPSSTVSSSSSITKQGTNSGVHAAQRLVEARREFMSLMNTELQLEQSNDENNVDKSSRDNSNNNISNNGVDVRKIYVLEGHGVPIQLLSHLIQAVQSWTASTTTTTNSSSSISNSSSSSSNTSQYSSQIVQISFENIHNTTLLNRDVIQIMYANGNTVSSSQQQQFIMGTTEEENNDWEHDFELYMVVMDRIASRLASIVLSGNENENDEVATTTDSTLGSSGSMITPASLKQWNVTMMKGEALPLSLLKKGKEGLRRQEYHYKQSIFLTVEWVMKNRSRNCCNIVLRLQHDGMLQDESGSSSNTKRESGRDPISLVFDGVYEQ